MADHEHRVELVTALLAGWSSGDPDAPEQYFHADGVLFDVASGRFEGWSAIRAFFATGSRNRTPRPRPRPYWANESGLAVHHGMSATVHDPAIYCAFPVDGGTMPY